MMDRFSARRMSKKDRQTESFFHPTSETPPPDSILRGLTLASRAPSAMNSQKWYYLVSRKQAGYRVEISRISGYMHFKWPHYNIDVGTAAAHFWLGLVSEGILPLITAQLESDYVVWAFHVE
jgi:nitroreductase